MFTMCNATLNACWDIATARRHWTEQWWHDQVRRCPLPNRTEFINFSQRDLISDDSSFCLFILPAIYLQCHVFPFEKPFLKVRLCQMWRHLCVTMLQCWAKFSNGLIRWSIWMICAKNYDTVSNLFKVMPRILWPLLSPDTVYKPSYGTLYHCITTPNTTTFHLDLTGVTTACRLGQTDSQKSVEEGLFTDRMPFLSIASNIISTAPVSVKALKVRQQCNLKYDKDAKIPENSTYLRNTWQQWQSLLQWLPK